MKKIELLAPAGNLEKLRTAVVFGADAVYCAGQDFGLRAFTDNFTDAQLQEGVAFAHRHGAKVYITVNIFAHNEDIDRLPGYLRRLAGMRVDGLIVSDPGVIRIAREIVPDLPLHLSTQANTTNWAGADFWAEQGIERVVLARELSIEEIRQIGSRVSMDLEVFVHGAMCISYSGRCLLSNYMTGRDANRGECAQACRWQYHLVERQRPDEYLPVEEDERGTYILNSKDLCMLEYIPELVQAGVNNFKIEGRMKSVHYVATVVRAYRRALDLYLLDPAAYRLPDALLAEVQKVSHRDYTTGFFFSKPGPKAHNYRTSSYIRQYDFVAVVKGYDGGCGELLLEQRNNFRVGETLEVLPPQGEVAEITVSALRDEAGADINAAPHPQQLVRVPSGNSFPEFSLLRRPRKE